MRGEVEERYVRWVRELSRGNGAEVSRAGDDEPHCQLEYLLRSDALAPNGGPTHLFCRKAAL